MHSLDNGHLQRLIVYVSVHLAVFPTIKWYLFPCAARSSLIRDQLCGRPQGDLEAVAT